MATIPSNMVAYIRNQTAGLLTETCVIKRKSQVRDANGDVGSDFVAVASAVPCRVLPSRSGSTSDAELIANKQIIGDIVRIILPYDTELEAGYEITVNDEARYLVVSIEDSRSSETDRQVTATRQR